MYIKDVLTIYKCVERKNKNKNLFYKELRKHIINDLRDKENNKDILLSYKISCESYIESDFLNFNINTISLIIALLSIAASQFHNSLILWLLLLDIFIGSYAIYYQSRKSKVVELLKVIDTINEDDLDNDPNIKETIKKDNMVDENVM